MEVIKLDVDKNREKDLLYVVIASKFKDEWVFVRHEYRETWEMPGGHIEKDEDVYVAGRRELYEETGAIDFKIYDVCDFDVKIDKNSSFSRLFYSDIKELDNLPEFEIVERSIGIIPKFWTYGKIQPILFEWVKEWLEESGI